MLDASGRVLVNKAVANDWSALVGVVPASGAVRRAAIESCNGAADLADQLQHHPDIMVRYNKVTLTVSTHDAGGITEKDFALAESVDGLIAIV